MTLVAPQPTTDITRWVPHKGPQERALSEPDNTFELLYGGSRGGGKTTAGLVWLTDRIHIPQYRGLVIRRNADDLSDWLDRAEYMYKSLGAEVVGKPAIIRFPSGAKIRTGHLRDDKAYTKYQGHEYQDLLVEELTQIASEERYLKLLSSCRSTIPGVKPRAFLTTNPGGVGHNWVKKRFVVPAEPMQRFPDPISGRLRIFIPASVDDNPTLMQNDPDYVMSLEALRATNENLWKAWRKGSWDVPVGQFFTEWDYDLHTTRYFDYGLDACEKILCFDWGYTAPGCAIWLARTPENRHGVRRVYAYRELYLTKTDPEQWAKMILTFVKLEGLKYMVLPHDCFSTRMGAETIAETFRRVTGVPIKRGETLSRGARTNRAAVTHRYLSLAVDNKPYLQIHKSLLNTIETLPELVHDELNPEDVDTDGADHAFDALSLGLMTLGWSSKESAVLKREAPSAVRRTWRPNEEGAIQSPDFATAFKEAEQSRKGTSNPEFK